AVGEFEIPMRIVRRSMSPRAKRQRSDASIDAAPGLTDGNHDNHHWSMASSMARGGRRRRVLNDEVLSASGANASAYVGGLDPDAPRYGEQANIENHPQVTDFVPRRKLAVLTTVLAGIGTAATAAAIAHYAEPISSRLPGVASSDLSDGLAWGVTAWSSAIAFVMIAM